MKTAYRSHSSPFIESSNPAGSYCFFSFYILFLCCSLLISFLFIIVETLEILHRKLTVDRCIERDDGLAARQSQWLQLIMDDFQQMVVVQRVNLDKHIKATCSGSKEAPDECFIIGGASIYEQALPFADKLYLTIVEKEPEHADTFFPEINPAEWEVTEKEMRNENGLPFTFLTLYRKQ